MKYPYVYIHNIVWDPLPGQHLNPPQEIFIVKKELFGDNQDVETMSQENQSRLVVNYLEKKYYCAVKSCSVDYLGGNQNEETAD